MEIWPSDTHFVFALWDLTNGWGIYILAGLFILLGLYLVRTISSIFNG